MIDDLKKNLKKRILILDGPMGTIIQKHPLTESDFRGEKFKIWKKPLKGNNDILNISKSSLIFDIHYEYLKSGCDIIETNTFNSTMTSQEDYLCQDYSYDLNFSGANIAKKCVDKFMKDNKNNEKKFVAGVLGPTNRTCSMSPDVNNPGFRNIDFDTLKNDYTISLRGLLDGGADLILIETIFDTLNAKAALMAVYEMEKKLKIKIPLMLSVTITDLSGRTLSGQTLEAFYCSIKHMNPIIVGLNCALGPKELEPHLIVLSRICSSYVSIHPNAGLPNAFGEYDETPESMAKFTKKWAENGYLNIVGGCCGTTPEHIKAMKEVTSNIKPREPKIEDNKFQLSGLENFSYR